MNSWIFFVFLGCGSDVSALALLFCGVVVSENSMHCYDEAVMVASKLLLQKIMKV